MFELKDINKSFQIGRTPRIHILKGVTCQFEKGQVISICGPSGCGKSTLMQIMGGLDTPDSGMMIWEQQNLAKWSKKRLAYWRNECIGFVFQSYHLLPELNALENVMLPAAFANHVNPKRAQMLLEKVGLSERLSHRPFELSGGEQQRVAIARALMNDPELILADEPTGNLDKENRHVVIDLLFNLVKLNQKTLILVTHDADIAERAEIQLKLVDGKLEKV
jgi:lipoprotein-releasing system ATP-binding protein